MTIGGSGLNKRPVVPVSRFVKNKLDCSFAQDDVLYLEEEIEIVDEKFSNFMEWE